MDLNLLELFCGSKSISKEAEKMGINTFTSDVNKRFKADYIVNIFDFDVNKVPFKPNIIWASPPCTWFSIASAWKHWNRDKTPKTIFASQAIEIIKITLNIIEVLQPDYWFIENPRGILRKLDLINIGIRQTVTYCQYGARNMKPTDIWTNNGIWKPRPMCEPGESCHKRQGTNKLNTPAKRSVIPEMLCKEILRSLPNNI